MTACCAPTVARPRSRTRSWTCSPTGAFAGNPLAVVLDADDLSTAAMQALATEFALSETAFPLRRRRRRRLPAAHLHARGRAAVRRPPLGRRRVGAAPAGPAARRASACSRAAPGLLPVRVARRRGGAVRRRRRRTARSSTPRRCSPPSASAADDLAGVPRAGRLRHRLHLPAGARVRRSRGRCPTAPRCARCPSGPGLSVTAYADGAAHSRVFVPEVGVAEDPATGSAAVGLGVFLAAVGRARRRRARVRRDAGGRAWAGPRRCAARCGSTGGAATATTVAGTVVPVARGEVRRPQPSGRGRSPRGRPLRDVRPLDGLVGAVLPWEHRPRRSHGRHPSSRPRSGTRRPARRRRRPPRSPRCSPAA